MNIPKNLIWKKACNAISFWTKISNLSHCATFRATIEDGLAECVSEWLGRQNWLNPKTREKQF